MPKLTRVIESAALAAMMAFLPAGGLAAGESTDLPEHAAEHVAGPAYLDPPRPEVNPWADKGIPSKHVFGALHTRRHYPGEEWHAISRTGEYTDVVVRFGDGGPQVLFGRVSSYHPEVLLDGRVLGSFPEIIARRGDGPQRRPDKINRYARARVIESNPTRALIHYRYLPAPAPVESLNRLNPPDQRAFVDEYFLFRPGRDGLRALRPGAPLIEDWRDPSRIQVRRFRIGGDGAIATSPATADDRTAMLGHMGFQGPPERHLEPAPLLSRARDRPAPVLAWTFDEGRGRTARETVSGDACTVEGHAAIWRRGISGSALLFAR